MKKLVISSFILLGFFQCSLNKKQEKENPQVRNNQEQDSSVNKNNQAVQIYLNARGNTDSLKKSY